MTSFFCIYLFNYIVISYACTVSHHVVVTTVTPDVKDLNPLEDKVVLMDDLIPLSIPDRPNKFKKTVRLTEILHMQSPRSNYGVTR